MGIQIKINNTDRAGFVKQDSLIVKQNLNDQVDQCSFEIRKNTTITPAYNDDVKVLDGTAIIFAGTILRITENTDSGADTLNYRVEAVDYKYELDKELAAKTYTDQTVKAIISDLLLNHASDFNADNVESDFLIEKIVFNQLPPSQCVQKLADIIRFEWYIDENKSINFFPKNSKSAPFDLTDTSGNYVYKSLERITDGSQVVSRVKVRGGEFDETNRYEDIITINGNDQKSFEVKYRMSGLRVWVDTGAGYVEKTVGQSFTDDFSGHDVLQSFQDRSIEFETALSNGDKIKYDGFRKVRVFAIAEDPNAKENYGVIEKLIRDNSIRSNAVARRRAAAELLTYQEPIVDAKFYTYESGLRVGMLINLTSTRRNCDDDFIIKSIGFKPIGPETFGYQAECVTTKRQNLIGILQRIMEPESLDIDEVEVSEQIFADTAEVQIQEEHELVAAQEDFAEIEIEEQHLLDPLGAGVEPTWVLAPYTPTSDTDPKRAGRLNISFKVY